MSSLSPQDPALREMVRQLVREEVERALASSPPRAASAQSSMPVPRSSSGIDGRTMAMISAAVVAAVGAGARIRRVTFLNTNTVSAWAELGRVSIQASHNFRR